MVLIKLLTSIRMCVILNNEINKLLNSFDLIINFFLIFFKVFINVI